MPLTVLISPALRVEQRYRSGRELVVSYYGAARGRAAPYCSGARLRRFDRGLGNNDDSPATKGDRASLERRRRASGGGETVEGRGG